MIVHGPPVVERHAEIDQSGERRHQELFYPAEYGMEWDDCTLGALARRVFVPGTRYGSHLLHAGLQQRRLAELFRIEYLRCRRCRRRRRRQDGYHVPRLLLNGKEQFAHLVPEVSQTSIMAYGEYTLEGDMNLTPYFEILHVTREFFSDAGAFQLFPDVPARNPFNLCNPEAENGVDCGLAWNAMLNNPNFAAQFAARYGVPPSALGFLYRTSPGAHRNACRSYPCAETAPRPSPTCPCFEWWEA